MTGCDAPTPPDSEDETALPDALAPPSSSVNDLEPEDSPLVNDEPELPEPEIQTGRQKARAAVMELHPPEMLAKLCSGFKKGNVRIVENIRGHYAVPPGTQPDGILSDDYRARMKWLYHTFKMQLDKDDLRVFVLLRKQELCHPHVQSRVL